MNTLVRLKTSCLKMNCKIYGLFLHLIDFFIKFSKHFNKFILLIHNNEKLLSFILIKIFQKSTLR